ncbi:MAG: hypothetical protein N3F66_13020 [Spirochaetes bacterium]|nr:hypothetical protein [Spirochaetota bacterium]
MQPLVKSFLMKHLVTDLSLKNFGVLLQNSVNRFLQRPHHTASFISLWYYIELLYMMNIAIFFYTPILIAAVGIIIGIVLSIHILKLYIGTTINYTIQLLLMDIHIAYSFGLTIATILSGATWYAVLIVVIRDIIAITELMLIYTMTTME